MSKDIIDALPAGRGQLAIAVLVPGMVTGGQDVGGQNTMALNQVAIHGGRSVDAEAPRSTSNTTINLVAPGALYGERLTQFDLRFAFDIYNATNGNTVRAVNPNYAAWLVPTGILDPRLFKISAQVDF